MKAFSINSALAFSTAMLATAALHETGHALAAQALGFAPKIYAFYEDNPTGTAAQSLLILAAGPIVSLIAGLALAMWYRFTTPRYSYWRLLLFWLAWLGIMQFVNYLIVTPWLSAGDTAQMADILRWPLWGRYAVSLAGIAILIALLRPAATSMFAAAPSTIPLGDGRDRRRYIMAGFYLPLLAGVALTAVAGIGTNPVAVLLGLLGTLGNIDVIALALFRANVAEVPVRAAGAPLRIEPVAIALWVAIVLFYVTLLPRGLSV
ncbi:MAG: hypothetical protein JO199_09160 [Candidatus Eremiobacteraeota bacterium]|nr:hypothetical protein [Candidatus Eremiobacteraeota bacterium]